MNANTRKFMDDYSRGMEMLSLSGRAFANLAQGLGYPIANEGIPTAQVQLNMDEKRIEFVINPNFIADLSDSDIAAVIAHETYHVLLDHLSEMADGDTYPLRNILIDAQECIINDSLPSSVGFETMDGTYKGMERHNQDFSNFTTQEGYDFILNKKQEEEDQKASDEDQEKEPSDGAGDSSDSSAGGDQEKDEEKSEGSSKEKPDNESSDEPGEDEDGAGGSPDESGDEDADGEAQGSGQGGVGDADSDGTPQDGPGTKSGAPAEGCHGVVITGEGSGDPQKVLEALGEAITNAVSGIDQNDLPMDVQDALDELRANGGDIPQPGYSQGQPKDGFNKIDAYADLNVKWRELLEEINPKMKHSGRPKHKDSWHAPRRRMLHSYPNVILPTRVRLDDPNAKKGDSIPSFVIALDMSGSIPKHLLGTLAAFARSVPEKLIKAFPITWSDGHKVFDPDNPRDMVHRGGTTISTVMTYVKKVEKETGTKPYVLVITDGAYDIPSGWNKAEIMERWYWMGIQSQDVQKIMNSTGAWTTKERVFDLNKFI